MRSGPVVLLLSLMITGCAGDPVTDSPAGSAGASAGGAGGDGGSSGATAGGASGTAGEGGQPGGAGQGGEAGGQAGSAGMSAGGQAGGGQAGGGAAGAGGQPGECVACGAYQENVTSVPDPYPALVELSGLAASRKHPGLLYAHNDSGDTARFFAITTAGAAAGEFAAQGATAIDWEDIAVGPCPAGSCVHAGDIGDNAEKRTEYAIIRVTEPELPADPKAPVVVPFEQIRFTYPDGSHNAETLLVHPTTGDVYVVTKGKASAVYRLAAPLDPAAVTVATKLVDFSNPGGVVTGGDIHPCGDRVLIGTYTNVLEYRVPAGMPFEAVFSATPLVLKQSPGELQSESFAYLATGDGIVTGSEDPFQLKPADLHLRGCQ